MRKKVTFSTIEEAFAAHEAARRGVQAKPRRRTSRAERARIAAKTAKDLETANQLAKERRKRWTATAVGAPTIVVSMVLGVASCMTAVSAAERAERVARDAIAIERAEQRLECQKRRAAVVEPTLLVAYAVGLLSDDEVSPVDPPVALVDVAHLAGVTLEVVEVCRAVTTISDEATDRLRERAAALGGAKSLADQRAALADLMQAFSDLTPTDEEDFSILLQADG